jgi:Flp pilus assembly pilin Flp
MIRNVMGFLKDERGVTAVEFAIVAALVMVGVVGGIDIMGQGADGSLSSVPSGQEMAAPASGMLDCGALCDKVN